MNFSVRPRPRNPRRYDSNDAQPSTDVATRCRQLIEYSKSSGPSSEPNVNDAYPSMPEAPRATTARCTSSLNHRPRIFCGHNRIVRVDRPRCPDTDAR